jgi:uncharacterized protein (DUF1330 family)
MPAFFVSRAVVKDPARMEEYATRAAETLKAHGAEPLLRGGFAEALLGKGSAHGSGIVRFADMQTLKAWFDSPEYRALAPLRDAACEMELFAYEVPA